MRSIIFAIFFGLFLTLSVIGVLSVSPLLDSPAADAKLASLLNFVLPQTKEDPPPRTEQLVTATDQTKTKILGLQTKSSDITPGTLYGLINGARRDKKAAALVVSQVLEQVALTVNTSRSNPDVIQLPEAESIIRNQGYDVAHFAILEARRIDSNWAALNYWQKDPRDELLLQSTAFQDMGLSVLCNPEASTECTVLLILASPRLV